MEPAAVKKAPGMGTKIVTVALLAIAIAAVMIQKHIARRDTAAAVPEVTAASGLPRLLDLGSDTCVPCKMMAPILAELKQDFAGRMEVAFIDVKVDPAAAAQYGVQVIPTQIFIDRTGRELFRHEGFLGKEDILKKWNELGEPFGAVPENAGGPDKTEPPAVPAGTC